MNKVDEILSRFESDGELKDYACPTHGTAPHLLLYNDGYYNNTSACVLCVVELAQALSEKQAYDRGYNAAISMVAEGVS